MFSDFLPVESTPTLITLVVLQTSLSILTLNIFEEKKKKIDEKSFDETI